MKIDSPCILCKSPGENKSNCIKGCQAIAEFKEISEIEYKSAEDVIEITERLNALAKKHLKKIEPKSKTKRKKIQKICIMLGCTKPVKARELCETDYDRWRHGLIEHPKLGKFKLSHPQKRKAKKPKKAPVATPIRPQDIITIDLEKYPQIRTIIFDAANEFLLPAEHIIMTLVGEGIAGKREIHFREKP